MTGIGTAAITPPVTVLSSAPCPDGSPGLVATAGVRLDEAELVFAGHYPDFPVFPGVLLIECARVGALAAAAGLDAATGPGELKLAAVESARFRGVALPGDYLSMEVRWQPAGGEWRASARIRSHRGEVASLRLRFRAGGPQ